MGMMQSSGQLAENLMGGGMSRMSGMGGPMLGGMQAMMGLDPLSMGMSAASRAWGGGAGVMGAGMAGIGMAAGVGAVGMGVQYAGGQMMQGAQNQMAFNNSMRQNFNFMRQDGTGQGFNRTDMTAISGTLQSMTHSYGPGGETAGFGELTKLASNMGRMGMTTGVRDAKEFSKKFKEMVGTLKTVAAELGTSMEAAQELLSSARGSGIFKHGDQLKFSSTMRTTGLAGGLATSEMTAMANIGSRVSRQFGGLGQSGAMGGIKALGQVGIAQQIGAVSEEDIYNATGATGAEGRAAYATEMLQNTGNFLKTGKGRYFLASVAGKDGKLNMNAANEYMMGGGMGTGRTKELANSNLKGVGRANFIRNEGRLRGEVMAKFGAMAPTMALMGWAQDRGININEMDDRSMLLAQRQLGMGRDEMDAAVKMADRLPDIMKEERNVARQDTFTQGKANYNKSRELRTRLEHIRHGVQEKLQSVGQDIFTSGSDFIENTMNKILGQFETYAQTNITEITSNMRSGGAGNTAAFQSAFGGGKQKLMGMNSKEVAALTGKRRAVSGMDGGDPAHAAEASRLAGLSSSAQFGTSATGEAYAGANNDALLKAYGTGIAGKQGDARVTAVAQHLEEQAKKGDLGAQKLLTEMRANPSNAAAIVGTMERKIGIDKESGLGASYGKGSPYGGRGGFGSEKAQNAALGDLFNGRSLEERASEAGIGKQLLGLGGVLAGTALNMGQAFGEAATYAFTGKGDNDGAYAKRKAAYTQENLEMLAGSTVEGQMRASIGAAFKDPETSRLIAGMASGEDKTSGYKTMANLSGRKDLSMSEKGTLVALRTTDFGMRYANLKKSGDQAGINALINEANQDPHLKEAMGGKGVDESSLGQMVEGVVGSIGLQQEINREKRDSDRGIQAQSGLSDMQANGFLTNTSVGWDLSSKAIKGLSGIGGKDSRTGVDAARMGIELLNKQVKLASLKGRYDEKSLAEKEALEGEIYGKDGYQKLSGSLANMSLADKRKFAAATAGSEMGDMALDEIGNEQKFLGISKAARGDLGATGARMLGMKGGKEFEESLKGKTPEEISRILAKAAGAKGTQAVSFSADLQKALEASKDPKRHDAGSLFSKAIQGAGKEVQDNIKRANAEDRDPLAAEMAKNTGKANAYLEVIAKSAGKADPAMLEAISKITNPDPEKK